MKKRSQNKNPAPADVAVEASETFIDGATGNIVTEELDIDPELLAMLSDDTISLDTPPVSDPDMTEGAEDVTEGAVDMTEVADDIEVTIESEDQDQILAALEGVTVVTMDEPATTTTKKTRAAKTPPVQVRSFLDVAAIDDATYTANLASCTATKVNEKVQNLVQAIEMGKKLSGYTATAIKALIASGRITSKTLVEAFEKRGLSGGTARAQAQQMTALFKVTGLVTPDATNPRELVLADVGLARELELLAA